jgi:hypothetical protein
MSEAREVLCQLKGLGATITPAGDRLLLRAGPKPVPAGVIRRIREAKAGLLVLLRQEATALTIMPGNARVVVLPDDERARLAVVASSNSTEPFCISASAAGPLRHSVRASVCAPAGSGSGTAQDIDRRTGLRVGA